MDITIIYSLRDIVLLCSYKFKSMDDNSVDCSKSDDDWESKKLWLEFNIQPRYKNIIDYFADYSVFQNK